MPVGMFQDAEPEVLRKHGKMGRRRSSSSLSSNTESQRPAVSWTSFFSDAKVGEVWLKCRSMCSAAFYRFKQEGL